MKYPPYPAYKSSGVAWLGNIPAHWGFHLVKRHFKVDLGKMLDGEAQRSQGGEPRPYLRAANVHWNHMLLDDMNEMKFTERELQRYSLAVGDLLVTEGGVTVGRSALWQGQLSECCYQNSLNRARPKGRATTKFLYFWMRFLTEKGYIELAAEKATFGHLTKEKLESLPMAVPAIPEQRAIAAFLDRETAKLDALIAKKERLIELLQEKRTALISHAVTKGLDPNAPLKDSGVEWLGQIPMHWQGGRIRDLAESLQTGPFGSQLHSDEYCPGGIPVVNPAHLRDGHIYPDDNIAVDKETWIRLSRHELHEGDIVFARRGEMGRCALVTTAEEGWLCGSGSMRMRPRLEATLPLYLNYVLSTSGVGDWLSLESVGTTMENLNRKIVGNIPVPIPPKKEQRAIAAYLDRETAKIDALVAKVRQAIERLREYRTALISAAVTGKIDVRAEGDLRGFQNLEGLPPTHTV